MKQLTYCIILAACFTACSGNTSPLEGGKRGVTDETTKEKIDPGTEVAEQSGAIEEEKPEPVPELTWNSLPPGEFDIPRIQIVLTVGDKKTILDTINNECSEIPRSEYAETGIPKDALTAFGGWYAGAGDYFYLTLKNGKPAVYHGWQDEGQQEAGYHWKKIKL